MKSSSRRLVLVGASLLAAATMSCSRQAPRVRTPTPSTRKAPASASRSRSPTRAQAHCMAQAPIVHAEVDASSNFNPAGHLPCPPGPNPGGQVHGD
jgi:hypothetical protein